ncbi:MAG TPA: NADP-dependent malic enzyme [Acholeplasmataceae bacterium]|jgi:malate dehydrogenase (oxaloacetate-decarboxylating)|nr:NADP-dependent malic enzyme [Acholeplasmataceae bacterium]
MNDLRTKALDFHKGGKLAIASKVKLDDRADLSLAYSPGVAYPCLEIAANPEDAYRYTSKKNTVAVISDGSAVLGLGDIGPLAAIPVMEGKCLLFKKFAGIDAIPIVLATKDTEEIIRTVQILAPSFGGINLEDIAFPRCVEIERRLIETLDIPVFHDDQRGTAVVTAAALISACKLVDKKFSDLRVAILGLGAAGTSIARLLKAMGIGTIYACNSRGIVTRKKPLSPFVLELLDAGIIDSYDDYKEDSIAEIMTGADVFIGVSRGNLLSVENVNRMADRPIVFALANPDPEISLEKIRKTKAYIYATGRSDYPNQINNVLAFPGIFRGALDAGFKKITESMCIAAARAIAGLVAPERLSPDYIIPSVFEADVVRTVSEAIKQSEETK